jgi:outer membrane protein assembly factor BamB
MQSFKSSLLSLLILTTLAPATFGQVALTGNRYDVNRTAANLQERILTPLNVAGPAFGKLWSYSVEGAIFAQPLYVEGVDVAGIRRNILYVATMHDVIYAFDATNSTDKVWVRDLRQRGVTAATHNYPVELGDAIGVLSTPVIDLPSNRMLLVAATRELGVTTYRIHSMNLSTGLDTIPAVPIPAPSTHGITLNWANSIQRAGLSLANGQLYVTFGGNPHDARPYHGWVVTYDMNTLRQSSVFVTTNHDGGAIWQSGGAPPVDSAGNTYYLTGNGFNTGFDGTNNFGETLLKMRFASGTLSRADSFTPANWSFLDGSDLDLSCTAPMLLPDASDLIAFGSKNATVYVAHRNALGGLQPNDRQLVQHFHVGAESFTSPAQGFPGILIGSSPALTTFKNRVYVAFQANDASHRLFVTSSPDGVTFNSPATGYPGILIGSAPAMAAFNGRLYIAFQANDASHKLFVTSSSDGVTFTTPAVAYPGILIGSAPAMAAFNGRLYIAFQANDVSHKLFVTSSPDGLTFASPATGYPGILIGSAPAMAAFQGRLYITFQANDPSHRLFVTSASDGSTFTSPALGFSGILIGSAPAMAVIKNQLYVSFQANDPGHALFLTSSSDGSNFRSPAQGYAGILIGSAPAMATLGDKLLVSFQANDPSHRLFVSSSSENGNTQVFNDGNRIIGLAYWQRTAEARSLLYAWPGNDSLVSYPLEGGKFNTAVARYGSVFGNGEPGVALSLSANGNTNGTGVVWAARSLTDRTVGSPGIVHAFDAETLRELWNSNSRLGDSIGAHAKFVIPVVANGRVYVATDSGHVHVFGLR